MPKMQRREKILLILFVSAIVGWRGLPILRAMVLGRLDDNSRRIAVLKSVKSAIDDKEFLLQIDQRRMSDWTEHSLPSEPVEAQRLYQEWLNDLADQAGFSSPRVTPEPLQGTPNASFRAVRVSVKGEATFEQLTYFLHEFYRADILHRVQALRVEGPPNPGGPLKITLMAEGLCLHDAANRNHLFPRTELADSLPRSFDSIKVSSADEFPKEPGFTVRIDNEFVTVTKVAGNRWTVKRAVEGTTKAYHAAKAEVEMYPVRFDQQGLTLEDRRKTLVKHPFVQPIPPQAPVADTNDPARQTKLMGTILTDSENSAWLINETTKINTVVKKGSPISIGDVQGTVVAIEPNAIHVKRGDDLWHLAIGKDLRSMTRSGGSGGAEDPMLSGFSDESPEGGRGGDPRNRDRSRSRRPRRPDTNFEPGP